MPNFQNPTGTCLRAARRRQMVALAPIRDGSGLPSLATQRQARSRRRSSCARSSARSASGRAARGAQRPQVEAICATQRFGSRLDYSFHRHAVLPDGVFVEEREECVVDFLKLAPPTRQEPSQVLERVVVKTPAMVKSRGLLEEEPCDALASVQAEAFQKALPLGKPAEEDGTASSLRRCRRTST